MKKRIKTKTVLKWINNYLMFFLLVAFVTTCCMSLFLSVLSKNLNITLTEDNIKTAAKLTFLNVLLISFIFATVDAARRRFKVELPAKRITESAERIMQGDFSARVPHQSTFGSDDSFNKIGECFNKMASELGSVETLRTDFIANVSHEMKTPLAVIQNYGILLSAEDVSDEDRVKYAKGVIASTRRMSDMITNILKLNKLENQQIFAKNTEINLSEQLCECLLQFENVWETSNINIETDIPEDITVRGDMELLSLVWNNLFSNAFKFTPDGGTVSVSLMADEDFATVKVKDTGCGMSADVGKHIFEKFYQGDTSHSTRGNGLGLSLVKKVIDIMHGEICVESAVGEGSTFTVKIQKTEI